MKKLIYTILIALVIFGGISLGIYLKTRENPIEYITAKLHIGIENTILSQDNCEESINDYIEKKGKNSDEAYYLSYSLFKYSFSNINSFYSNPYSNFYGKTINELIKESKEDMRKENISIEDFKKSLTDFDSSSF